MADEPEAAEDDRRRRLLVLLLVGALVAIGAGFGGLELSDEPGGGPPAVDVTPVPTETAPAETPARTPDEAPSETPSGTINTPAPSGTATASATAPADSPTPGSAPAEPRDDGDGRDDPRPTETATPTTAPTDGTGEVGTGDSGAGDGGPSLVFEGPTALVQLSGPEPGAEGRRRVRIRNAGDASGRLAIATVTAEDSENGIVEPERPVDGSPGEGELSEHLQIALLAGSETAVIGTESDPTPLAAVAASDEPFRGPALGPGEKTTLVLRWRVPAETGNEVQSDGVTFAIEFRLRAIG